MNIDEAILSKLTDEQKKKALAAKTPEDLLAVAKETGYELSRDQLDEISGGWDCPFCGIDVVCEEDEWS